MAAAEAHSALYVKGLKDALINHEATALRLTRACGKVTSSTQRFDKNSSKVCSRIASFDEFVSKEARRIEQTVADNAFLFPKAMISKMENLKLDNHHFMRDLKVMEARVRAEQGFGALERAMAARWPGELLPRLRDLVRRSPVLPPSGLRFVAVALQVLMQGWPISRQIFFSVLEQTITEPHDHSNGFVHKVVAAVREAPQVQVSAEEWLLYLQSKGVEEYPEITADIRAARKKRKEKERAAIKGRTRKAAPAPAPAPPPAPAPDAPGAPASAPLAEAAAEDGEGRGEAETEAGSVPAREDEEEQEEEEGRSPEAAPEADVIEEEEEEEDEEGG
jgi:hypothetical protein